jgi:hypothetical protein
MGIVLPVPVERPELVRILERRGWRPVTLNGRPAYEKAEGIWLWLARLEPHPEFISWVPEEEEAHRHAEGLRRLQVEVDAICAELRIPLVSSLTLHFEA